MLKYTATALALKAFSLCGPTRDLYRYIGNTVGRSRRARSTMPTYYVERVERMLDLANRFQVVQDGTRMLELGTGWMHWEALTARIFFSVRADLYDVWDNRQLPPLKHYLTQLLKHLEELPNVSTERRNGATSIAKEILQVPNFEELYRLLGFRYILEPTGMLDALETGSYDLIVSAGVFEHLQRSAVSDYIRETYRLLRPEGYAIHSINTTDHLYHYDTKTSPKNYLRFSSRQWRLFFDNKLQYINRLQRREWMDIFDETGFTCIEEASSRCDLSDIRVHPQFQHMDLLSLETTSWVGVYQKPATPNGETNPSVSMRPANST